VALGFCRLIPVRIGWANFGLDNRGEVLDVERLRDVDRHLSFLGVSVGWMEVSLGHTLRPLVNHILLSWGVRFWQFFIVLSVFPIALDV
jgi:hypothetical protein